MNRYSSRIGAAVRAGVCAGLTLMALACWAQAGPGADAIMAKVDQLNRPRYEIAKMRMELVGEGTERLRRELVWYFVNDGDNRISLLKFSAPASVKSVGTMVVEEAGKANAIWHYLPATRNVRRISAEHRQNRFMGTEFVFEDFEGLKLSKYKFKLLRAETCGSASRCHVIEAIAGDPEERDSSSYGKKVFWIDQDNFAIVRTELYDRNGAVAKIVENSDFRQIGGHWRARRQVMLNVRNGHSTVLTEIDRKVDAQFDRYYVSQQYLRSE